MTKTQLANDFSLLRICSLGLVDTTRSTTPTAVIRHLLAMQGQQVNSVPHAIIARLGGVANGQETLAVQAVWQAFANHEILRSWPMRGTLHISTREDHHWLRAALLHRYGSTTFSDRELQRSAHVARELIAHTGGATKRQLRQAWEDNGLVDPTAQDAQLRYRSFLMRLHYEGILVGAQQVGGEHLIIDASQFPDADSSPVGEGVAFGQKNHDAAITHIAARYAWSHGPVSAADLARWTGLSLSVSARALRQAVEESSLTTPSNVLKAQGELVWVRAVYEGDTEVGVEPCAPPHGNNRSEGGIGMRGFFVMRADLLDILAQSRQEAESLHYLPSFDELHVGYKTRLSLTDLEGERLICPSNNGLFRPICVKNGRVIAVNPARLGLLWAHDVDVDHELDSHVRQEISRFQTAVKR